ncbi:MULTISPECIES: ABC transporter permease [Streptococcus]|uniref:Glycine betaine/carnitine/choline/choline sulfate ABC transporter (Promiscuous permease) n=1 Tax=Streptococcus thermophilus TaxID=1308 RepID=A0A7U7H360_STRTR|nr:MULTISPECIES: ABC transporter permease [Streptococcus]CCF01615.1 Osmotically activated L-carnitine/choline ABC transporter, permease protein OpuCD [Streptococcus macedonicus ACA-DC 198]PHV59192.1 ABC transporter permease [Streptococcus macedonicus]CAD0139586.1 glycine betaine/carnitine/choline/choline sulfate ABC transporter (promiscuous permease) [Streptococcus thermophilus]CAD0145017.1 glycine betaine/carnitine/choline/choline sulfate ABC transporter (promiscuous permease) [Streptococcus t
MENMNLFEQFIVYFQENGAYVFHQFIRHFLISIYGVLFAAAVAIPIGIYIARRKKMAHWVIRLASIIQTVPSLAMVSMLMLAFGLGVKIVLIATFLYSLLPILTNTYTGIRQVDKNVLDAGRGMGMNKWQSLFMIELPLSISVIMAGIRNALVMAIGVVAIGAFVGAGGLGDIIIRGTNATNGGAIILAGALPTALMAILADWGMGIIEKKLDPVARIRKKAH